MRILIVEDCREVGSTLRDYLTDHLTRLVSGHPEFDGGAGYPDACGEPGRAQLRQYRHALEKLPDEFFSVAGVQDEPARPTVELFPLNSLGSLLGAGAQVTVGDSYDDVPDLDGLRAQTDEYSPDILLVDLALSDDEVGAMVRRGGDRAPRRRLGITRYHRTRLKDPRPALRQLTGFKLLLAYARDTKKPVIVMTYSRNPLVYQHCLVSGAFGMLQKPVDRRDMARARGREIYALELDARRNEDALAVLVTHFLTAAAAEVVRAMIAVGTIGCEP